MFTVTVSPLYISDYALRRKVEERLEVGLNLRAEREGWLNEIINKVVQQEADLVLHGVHVKAGGGE